MPVVISRRYRPKSEALSELPRATNTIRFISRDFMSLPRLASLFLSSLIVLASACGCSVISESIKDTVHSHSTLNNLVFWLCTLCFVLGTLSLGILISPHAAQYKVQRTKCKY